MYFCYIKFQTKTENLTFKTAFMKYGLTKIFMFKIQRTTIKQTQSINQWVWEKNIILLWRFVAAPLNLSSLPSLRCNHNTEFALYTFLTLKNYQKFIPK